MQQPRRHPPATVAPDHPAAKLPRRRLALLRPGMVVEGVITRMVRGGVLVDIQLDSGEPAFVPLSEIPPRSMPKVRQLLENGAMQAVRIIQLDRAQGIATASLQGLLGMSPAELQAEEDRRAKFRRELDQPPPPPEPPRLQEPARKITASERARLKQQEILRKLRGQS
jgi:predicted RNA-binding protein with RPS1 domain